jgi:hypothetical protein
MGKINNPGYAGRAVREVLGPAVAGFVEGPQPPEVTEANQLLASLESSRDDLDRLLRHSGRRLKPETMSR